MRARARPASRCERAPQVRLALARPAAPPEDLLRPPPEDLLRPSAEADDALLAALPPPPGWRAATKAELLARGMAEAGHDADSAGRRVQTRADVQTFPVGGWRLVRPAGLAAGGPCWTRRDPRQVFLAADWRAEERALGGLQMKGWRRAGSGRR